jgi:hypothetical protein
VTTRDSPVRATVDKIVNGEHGYYAVTRPEDLTLREQVGPRGITFSLEPDPRYPEEEVAWKEPRWPKPGDKVLLHDINDRARGYRAHEATFSRPGT